jgi:ribosomal subunit interface protein
MDLRLQTRGGRIGDRLRQIAAHKLSGLERMEPALVRVEIEVISQKNSQRVEAVAATARKTFRAHADAREVESALDVVVDKLERQVRDHHKKRRARLIAGAGRVKSAQSIGEGKDRATRARDGDETS